MKAEVLISIKMDSLSLKKMHQYRKFFDLKLSPSPGPFHQIFS